jgi:putative ABC transport system permease protein
MYITDVEDMEEIRAFNDRDMDQQERLYMAMCVFLMVNVFLGLLGSFWFRTQQRASEIAIRMVSGASPRHIIARVLAEPLLLLLATVPFAAAVVWLLRGAEEFVSQQVELDVLHAVGVVGAATYAEMALMVVLGVLFPAVKAMRMRPAAVLQEE